MCLFSFGKLFCDLFLLFFIVVRNGNREDRWERKARGRCTVCKVSKHRTVLFQMLPSEIVNPNIKLLHLRGLEAQAKPHKTQVQSTCKLYEALHTGL